MMESSFKTSPQTTTWMAMLGAWREGDGRDPAVLEPMADEPQAMR
jgi:hypothetical protein